MKPGGRLSLQKALSPRRTLDRRARHGGSDARRRDRITCTRTNSIYLPIGCEHRLTNPGKINLELIEVQTGSYLGEDDIIRIEDVYNRG